MHMAEETPQIKIYKKRKENHNKMIKESNET
jgi:hypothetical protein